MTNDTRIALFAIASALSYWAVYEAALIYHHAPTWWLCWVELQGANFFPMLVIALCWACVAEFFQKRRNRKMWKEIYERDGIL